MSVIYTRSFHDTGCFSTGGLAEDGWTLDLIQFGLTKRAICLAVGFMDIYDLYSFRLSIQGYIETSKRD